MLTLLASSIAVASGAMALAFPSSPLPKLVMLDRDGVINQDVGSPGVVHREQFELTPGAANAIGTLKRKGCQVVVITNQSCVGKGLLTLPELGEIHDKMEFLLKEQDDHAVIDRIYICTSIDNNDPRKKPNPGMIIEACRDFEVDPTIAHTVFFVGDTLTDLQAAKSAGVQHRILVETGYGFGLMGGKSASIPAKVVEEIDLGATNDVSSYQNLGEVTPFLYIANFAEAVGSIIAE